MLSHRGILGNEKVEKKNATNLSEIENIIKSSIDEIKKIL